MGMAITVVVTLACLIIGMNSSNPGQGLLSALFAGGMTWFAFVYKPKDGNSTQPKATLSDTKPKKQELTERLSESVNSELIAIADSGDVDAQILVGIAYLLGINGVQCDIDRAGKYFLLAAEQRRHYFASYILGGMYRAGRGFDKDVHKAYRWALECKRQLFQADHDRAFNKLLKFVSDNGDVTIFPILSCAKDAQNSFPRYENEVAISHEKLAKKLNKGSYSTMRGAIGESDDRPFVFGRGPLPVAYMEYVMKQNLEMDSTSWPSGNVVGHLRNMKPGDILVIPGWQGTTRREDQDEAYDLTDDGWVPHRR